MHILRSISFNLTIVAFISFAFETDCFSQDALKTKHKLSVRRDLKKMLKKDQLYRNTISKPGNTQNVIDSLWVLQNKADSVNMVAFKSIIDQHGYPSLERVGTQLSYVLILHFTRPSDFEYLYQSFTTELQHKNMPAIEFAKWYDRCMIMSEKPVKYGAYGNQKICGQELIDVNRSREEIGLEKLVVICN